MRVILSLLPVNLAKLWTVVWLATRKQGSSKVSRGWPTKTNDRQSSQWTTSMGLSSAVGPSAAIMSSNTRSLESTCTFPTQRTKTPKTKKTTPKRKMATNHKTNHTMMSQIIKAWTLRKKRPRRRKNGRKSCISLLGPMVRGGAISGKRLHKRLLF